MQYDSSYGAFWLSYAAILIPGFGIIPAYAGATIDPHALDNALGIFLISWGIFTFILWIGTLRSTVALSSMFFVLTLTFFFLASGHLAHLGAGNYPTRVGGGLGIVTALLAWYNAAAGLYVPSATFVRLPVGPLGHTHSK
jgi:succinate-acetate transporter protein